MELTFVPNDGYVLARTNGPIDDSAREVILKELHPVVAVRETRLILDLAGSPRINSQGISSLVTLVAHANTGNSRVILCNLQPFVATVISVTKLDKFFTIAASLEAAVGLASETQSSSSIHA